MVVVVVVVAVEMSLRQLMILLEMSLLVSLRSIVAGNAVRRGVYYVSVAAAVAPVCPRCVTL